MRIAIFALSAALLPCMLQAQAPQPAPHLTPLAVTPDNAPVLSEADKFTMSDFDNQIAPIAQQMQMLQQKRAAWVAALNASHPGWVWYDAQRQGEQSGFRPVNIAPPPVQNRTPAK